VPLFLRGDAELGSGWMNRAKCLLRDEPEGPDHGYVLNLDIEAARKAAAEAGVSDRATFETAFADAFPGDTYDLICRFDALPDMGDPIGVARHIRDSLAHDGVWMVTELNAGNRVEDNVNVLGRFFYSASSFICVPNAPLRADDWRWAPRPVRPRGGRLRSKLVSPRSEGSRLALQSRSGSAPVAPSGADNES
jgi:hypothetical protein